MLARHRRAGARGRSVLKNAGVYTTLDVPTSDQVDAADIAYIGGHIYEITDEEYNALIAAGYSPSLGLGANILLESDFSLATETGEPMSDELGLPLEYETLEAQIVQIGVLLTESGDKFTSEYV